MARTATAERGAAGARRPPARQRGVRALLGGLLVSSGTMLFVGRWREEPRSPAGAHVSASAEQPIRRAARREPQAVTAPDPSARAPEAPASGPDGLRLVACRFVGEPEATGQFYRETPDESPPAAEGVAMLHNGTLGFYASSDAGEGTVDFRDRLRARVTWAPEPGEYARRCTVGEIVRYEATLLLSVPGAPGRVRILTSEGERVVRGSGPHELRFPVTSVLVQVATWSEGRVCASPELPVELQWAGVTSLEVELPEEPGCRAPNEDEARWDEDDAADLEWAYAFLDLNPPAEE